MKYIRYCISLLLVMALATACSDDYYEENGYTPAKRPYFLYVKENNFSFSSYNTQYYFQVYSYDTPWSFQGNAAWISLSPSSGSSDADVILSVAENSSANEGRTSIFNLVSTDEQFDLSIPMSVSQSAAKPYINVAESELNFSAARTTQTIEVNANVDWKINNYSSWITCKCNGTKLEITVEENTGMYSRSAEIYLYSNGCETSIYVSQNAPNITSETESIVVDNTASTVKVKVNSETQWKAETSDSWIEVSPETGVAGESELTVNIAANDNTSERNGTVYLLIGTSYKISIPVRQKGLYIEADVSSLSFVAAGENQTLNICSNTSWAVASYPDWIKPSQTVGEGNAKLTLTAYENPNTTSRTGYVHLNQEGLNLDVSIRVTQNGKTFSVNKDFLNFTDKEGTQKVEIKTDGSWSAQTTETWITLFPALGTGDSELSVSVSENTFDDDRNGSIAITMGDKTEYVGVWQIGKYFTVSDEALQIGSTGGSVSISVNTNDSWTATFDGTTASDWLTLSATEGSGTAEITVAAADNPSVNSRSAALIIATPHGQSVRIIISQTPRQLSVSASRVMLLSKGGTSSLIEVSTDGKYKVETQDTWFTIATVKEGFSVTAGPNTTKNNRMGSVTVSLTDLKEGSLQIVIPVIQTVSGATFFKTGYETDTDWIFKTGSLTLVLGGYGTDEDWNPSSSAEFKVIKTGYTDDNNWNNTNYGSGNLDRTDFGKDQNHDKAHGTGGNMNREDYTNDNDWNPKE